MPVSDDDSDDDLLTTPVFRTSDRRRTLAQQKSGNAIEELIRNSKRRLEESTRIQQMQQEHLILASSVKKRKVEPTQAGFFEVEDEEDNMDVPEKRRRAAMLEHLKGRYDLAEWESTLVFQPDSSLQCVLYDSLEKCIKDLQSLLQDMKDPKLKKSFLSVVDNPFRLKSLLKLLPSAAMNVPASIVSWLFRVAISEANVRDVAQGAHQALVTLMQKRKSIDLSDEIFQIDQLLPILADSRMNKGKTSGNNKTGLANLLRIVALLPDRHFGTISSAFAFQETLIDVCMSLSKSNGHCDLTILDAAEQVLAILWGRQQEEMEQLAVRMMKGAPSDPWNDYPLLAQLVPCFCKDEMPSTAACSLNTHLSLQALRHCLEGELDDLLVPAFQLIDGAEETVNVAEKSLQFKAMASSYAALQALRTQLEGLNSAKEANTLRCFAVGQAAVLTFASGILSLGTLIQGDEGGKEYGTRETMSFVFSLCDKLGSPLDFLTSYSNRYSADEHFRRLNCWLMILDFYRLETLKKLKPKFDDDTLVQKNLTSFFYQSFYLKTYNTRLSLIDVPF